MVRFYLEAKYIAYSVIFHIYKAVPGQKTSNTVTLFLVSFCDYKKKKTSLMMIKTVQTSGSILAQASYLLTTPLVLPSRPWVRSLLSPPSPKLLRSLRSHVCQLSPGPLHTRLIPIPVGLISLPIIPWPLSQGPLAEVRMKSFKA